MMNGSRNDSYCDAITAYTSTTASSRSHCSWLKAFVCSSTSAPKPTEKSGGTSSSGSRAITLSTASESGTSISAFTRTMRSWLRRWISTGLSSGCISSRLRAGTTWPAGVLISTSATSAMCSRSSSRSRTMIGYSWPRSR